jgi:hypothetical protein
MEGKQRKIERKRFDWRKKEKHYISMFKNFGERNRVTRLGEFSNIGYFFTLDSVMKITKVAQILGLHTFFHGTRYVCNLSKNVLGNILGDFFHKFV